MTLTISVIHLRPAVLSFIAITISVRPKLISKACAKGKKSTSPVAFFDEPTFYSLFNNGGFGIVWSFSRDFRQLRTITSDNATDHDCQDVQIARQRVSFRLLWIDPVQRITNFTESCSIVYANSFHFLLIVMEDCAPRNGLDNGVHLNL